MRRDGTMGGGQRRLLMSRERDEQGETQRWKVGIRPYMLNI